ncbi:MAG: hypothetical protein CML24_06700 [Rhizobiales bacterium]|nr:hypothetical protein [Hyphomicrobiales bacterium]
MAKMDMFSNVDVDIALSNELYANGMDQNGLSVDMQGFESVVFEILAGVLATAGDTDGTYVLYLQEADEDPNNPGVPGAYTAVDQNFIQGGNFPADVAGKILEIDGTDADERDSVYWFGYVGSKRFIRLQMDVSAVTNGMPLGAIATKGNPHSAPVSA